MAIPEPLVEVGVAWSREFVRHLLNAASVFIGTEDDGWWKLSEVGHFLHVSEDLEFEVVASERADASPAARAIRVRASSALLAGEAAHVIEHGALGPMHQRVREYINPRLVRNRGQSEQAKLDLLQSLYQRECRMRDRAEDALERCKRDLRDAENRDSRGPGQAEFAENRDSRGPARVVTIANQSLIADQTAQIASLRRELDKALNELDRKKRAMEQERELDVSHDLQKVVDELESRIRVLNRELDEVKESLGKEQRTSTRLRSQRDELEESKYTRLGRLLTNALTR